MNKLAPSKQTKLIFRFFIRNRFSTQQNQKQSTQQQTQKNQKEEDIFYDKIDPSTGDRNTEPEPEYEQSSSEKGTSVLRKIIRYGFYTFFGVFSYQLYLSYNSKNPEKETGYISPVYSLAKKTKEKMQSFNAFFTKPFSKKLLPDPSFIVYGPIIPKTVVLNLSGTVIHTSFIMGTGHKVLKRPGLNQMLQRLSRACELVILSDDDTFFVMQVRQNLDPDSQLFLRDFGRESLVYNEGHYCKDLKYLNRDPKNVIIIDNDPSRVLEQYRQNGIFLSTFDGNTDDNELIQTIPLIEKLVQPNVKDVREELKKYGNNNPGIKYYEELKQKKIQFQQMQKNVFGGLLKGSQNSNPNFKQQF